MERRITTPNRPFSLKNSKPSIKKGGKPPQPRKSNEVQKKKQSVKDYFYHSKSTAFARMFTLCSLIAFESIPAVLSLSTSEQRQHKKHQMAGLIRTMLGTQQPIIRCRTGGSNLTTTAGSVLQTVINMDVSGISAWTSFAAIFDEYRVRKATIHIIPLYIGAGTAIGTGTQELNSLDAVLIMMIPQLSPI
jgi:hypothetical protein